MRKFYKFILISSAFLFIASFVSAEEILSLRLINSSTDTEIRELKDGDTIDVSSTPMINVQAITSPATVGGKVYFSWSGAESGSQAEGVAPYAMKKDTDGDYWDWTPAVGNYTIEVYATDALGTAGPTITRSFVVVSAGGGGGGDDEEFMPEIKFPGGRIAFSSDGNQHDKDDFGATALSIAILKYAGLADKFVHYDHSDHMGDNNVSMNNKMIEAALGGAQRFGLDETKVFDDQKEAAEAVANFAAEAAKSSADNPLWFICAGPMEIPWRCLNASPADKRQYIHCISHSTWNENHNDALNYHTWADMKSDFPTVKYYDIIDQNSSNGDNDFNTPYSYWEWLNTSDNPDWKWLYERNEKNTFDVSDAGMTFWLITGGPNGGNDKGGWREIKALFNNPIGTDPDDKDGDSVKDDIDNCPDTYNKDQSDIDNDGVGDACDDDIDGDGIVNAQDNCPLTPNADQADRDNDGIGDVCDQYPDDPLNGMGDGMITGSDYVIWEAESTKSPLGLWKLIKNGETNYVSDASSKAQLEFTGNGINGGSAQSPLEYTFTCPKTATYRLTIRCRKRLEGEPGDKCNDGYVKLAGNFDTGNDIPVADLKSNEKFFGGNANDWGWANQLDWQGNIKRPALYKLTAGETYTLTISGRSIRWNTDYILLYDNSAYSLEEAQAQLRIGSVAPPPPDHCYTFKALDFDKFTGISGYVDAYADNARDALAINAAILTNRDKYAAAQETFTGKSGKYKITLVALKETDGESSYKIKIGDNYLDTTFVNDETSTDYAPQYHAYSDSIQINNGDVMQVEFMAVTNGKIPEGDGTAYSRGRWTEIFLDQDGCGPELPKAQPDDLVARLLTQSSSEMTLQWLDIIPNETGFIIERSLKGENNFEVVDTTEADVNSFTDKGLDDWTLYEYRVSALYEDGVSEPTAPVLCRTYIETPATLPEPWQSISFSDQIRSIATTARADGSKIIIDGGDGDFWTGEDRGHFVYQPLSGDGEIIARVTGYDGVQAYTMAGVMMRESLDVGSKFAAVFIIEDPGPVMRERVETSGDVNQKPVAKTGENAPHYVRLKRDGNQFTGSHSADGSSWTDLRTVIIQMDENMFVGVAATTHTEESEGTYEFENITVNKANSLTNNVVSRQISVYPNPVKDLMVIDNLHGIVKIELISTDGRIIKEFTVSDVRMELDVSGIDSGLYLIRLQAFDNEMGLVKVVIK